MQRTAAWAAVIRWATTSLDATTTVGIVASTSRGHIAANRSLPVSRALSGRPTSRLAQMIGMPSGSTTVA